MENNRGVIDFFYDDRKFDISVILNEINYPEQGKDLKMYKDAKLRKYGQLISLAPYTILLDNNSHV